MQALEAFSSTRARKSPRQTEHRTGKALLHPDMCCTRAVHACVEGSSLPVPSLSMQIETRLYSHTNNVYANGSNLNDSYEGFFKRRIKLSFVKIILKHRGCFSKKTYFFFLK